MGDLRVSLRGDEVVVAGDREALAYLADVCLNLSKMTAEDVQTGNNHYHIADYMNNAEEGSIPTIILCTAKS